jgi:hypothetical protein
MTEDRDERKQKSIINRIVNQAQGLTNKQKDKHMQKNMTYSVTSDDILANESFCKP